jgi:hypothetical protein
MSEQKKRVKVEPIPEGKLEQLLIANKRAKDAADIAGEEASVTKSEIKAWLLDLFPDGKRPDAFDIPADAHGRYPAYSMTLKEGFRLDTTAMKAEDPELYVRYAKKSAPVWELRER